MAPDDLGLDYIIDFFGDRIGYLVDIGAHDGVERGSMSRELMVKGWRGMLVEPLPKAFALLQTAYQNEKGVTCIQAACSDVRGQATLYPCDGVSTLEKAWAQSCENWWEHINYEPPLTVETFTLEELLASYAPPKIDYLQIDTEGHDFKVLLGMDWSFDPDLVCIETLDMTNVDRKNDKGIWLPSEEIDNLLVERGYVQKLLTIGGNGIYVKKERA